MPPPQKIATINPTGNSPRSLLQVFQNGTCRNSAPPSVFTNKSDFLCLPWLKLFSLVSQFSKLLICEAIVSGAKEAGGMLCRKIKTKQELTGIWFPRPSSSGMPNANREIQPPLLNPSSTVSPTPSWRTAGPRGLEKCLEFLENPGLSLLEPLSGVCQQLGWGFTGFHLSQPIFRGPSWEFSTNTPTFALGLDYLDLSLQAPPLSAKVKNVLVCVCVVWVGF